MKPFRPYRSFQLESPEPSLGRNPDGVCPTLYVGIDVLIDFHRQTTTIAQLSFDTTTMGRKQSLLVLYYSM